MRIVIATPYFAPKIGGLELYAEHIALGLASLGHDVHIITSGAAADTRTRGPLTIHTLKAAGVISNTPYNLRWRGQARRLIRELRPDLINVHAPVPTMALAVAKAAGRRRPLVVTYHAGSMKKGTGGSADLLIGLYERLLLPRLLRRANAVIAASDFVRHEFLGSRYAQKTVTVTPGVDGRRFWPARDRRVAGRIVFVGDFRDPRKGLRHLIDATAQVPGASLLVLGQGTGPAASHVHYAGIQTGPALVRTIQSASLLVLPSTTDAESFGMVLLEAMACGVPVIGSDIGGIPYVIKHGHNGLLVPPSDPAALAQTIQHILAYPQMAEKLGVNGRQDAVQHYSWQERIKQTHNLFELVRREVTRG